MATFGRRTPDRRAPFVMSPFRGLRFSPDVVGDLGTVVSPPYDVLDADTVRDLEAANRRNIVRLILARRYDSPYLAVRRRLDRWRAEGCLVPDPDPVLYLYQYVVDGVTVRGLVGLVHLYDEEAGVILPHEDVMPGPVADRTALMSTTRTNPEPILLVHKGTPRLRDLLEECATTAPVAEFAGPDGSRHRLWTLHDRTRLAAIATELADTTALIADGHHRYAAYLRLRDAQKARGDSAWDRGLAMLVDQDDYPLTIGPIHRSVNGLTLTDVMELSVERGDRIRPAADREAAVAALRDGSEGDTATFVLSDGRSWAVLSTGRDREVDAAVLHEDLLPAWNVTEGQVAYHHSLDQALHTASRVPGVVVALRPPTLDQVMASASRGERLPRKSTSFGPKPRMGLVLRDLRDR